MRTSVPGLVLGMLALGACVSIDRAPAEPTLLKALTDFQRLESTGSCMEQSTFVFDSLIADSGGAAGFCAKKPDLQSFVVEIFQPDPLPTAAEINFDEPQGLIGCAQVKHLKSGATASIEVVIFANHEPNGWRFGFYEDLGGELHGPPGLCRIRGRRTAVDGLALLK